ncbi:DUF6544 family protein [Leptolyngbya sp. CCNP1308]|uniref:DUF6920 family protein n=1 Tax=Leptolyngbya sp. CCNP1308 TaxID=3110255 RepID=UPI002B1FA6C5|nr:DUF6544 family protein [Leptolyngbya sp. CCNP1308]MEA5451867.1 DUF6544 family protein [Leptolyngbya sp. CCNP1308]
MKTKQLSLDALWELAISQERVFSPDDFVHLPDAARRYLEHAMAEPLLRRIAPGTAIASAVRLKMHGEIKLKNWIPFTAEQVVCWDHGFIWSATAWMNRLPIVGSDRIIDGVGAMQWKLLGLFPVMTGTGVDITRSAAGRFHTELILLPSALYRGDVTWSSTEASHLHASFMAQGEQAELDLTIDQTGRLKAVKMPRWGNPEGGEHHYVDFGAIIEEEGTFCGYTIPTRLRVGWYFGTERFESEGEFFRATIDEAIYR